MGGGQLQQAQAQAQADMQARHNPGNQYKKFLVLKTGEREWAFSALVGGMAPSLRAQI